MRLVSVYQVRDATLVLYDLLKERVGRSDINISHDGNMPTLEEHALFVRKGPYLAWYLIPAPESAGWVGSIYLTRQREIGIFIFEAYQHQGFGTQAVTELLKRWPGVAFAHVNPQNEKAHQFWTRLGGKLVQMTYKIEPNAEPL